MIRTIVAGSVFTLVYGVAIRLYVYLRNRRPSEKWHVMALIYSGLVGGTGVYLAEKIRHPVFPQWLDLPAFLILAFAASSIPIFIELRVVLTARWRKNKSQSLNMPPPLPNLPKSEPQEGPTGSSQKTEKILR